jgi:hypothetical protein
MVMVTHAVFNGLVIDENDQVVGITYVGDEPCYVVNDAGFKRHIPSADVDRQVLKSMVEMIKGNEEALGEQTAKMLHADDIFTRAMIQNQLKQIDQQIDKIMEMGIPEEGRAYMGMMGFRIVINRHGEVIRIEQPGRMSEDDGE